MHEANAFVTLTYSPECMPEDWSLKLRDWQLFRKKLREVIGPFRFFHAGEYGGVNQRPHYHAIIFGYDFPDRVVLEQKGKNRLWTSPELERVWGMGHVSVGQVDHASCAYVTKYCVKKQSSMRFRVDRVDADTGECWQVEREYVTMSRRPGLGSGWFERYSGDVYPSDEVVLSGRRMRPPRFYDDRLASEPDFSGVPGAVVLESLKVARRARAIERKEESTPERLAVSERVAEARLGLLKR